MNGINYKNFIEKYYNNRDIVKDNSFKTIMKFMTIFKKNIKENLENSEYIFNEIQKFKEDDYIENTENEYLGIIYIMFLTENTENKDFIKEFYLKFFSFTLNNYNLRRVILNCRIFKKSFNMIIKELYKYFDDLNNFIYVMTNEITKINENNNLNIYLFLFYCKLFSISQSNDLLINPNYIDIVFVIQNIIKLNLDSNLEDIEIKISSVQSIFNYIFEKHFLLLQKININQYEALINYFIHKLSEKEISFYENYICILEDLLLNNNNLLPSLSSVCLNILTSNNRFLHKIAINILKKCLRNKEIDTVFLEYYISIYDSLDGYNSKIFKSLVSNLEYVINFINNYQNLKEKELDIQNLLTDPMNYLIILTRKIINNSNIKIKKIFIKTLCKININNQIFSSYLCNDFLQLINNPQIYPENKINSLYLNIGVIIEDYLTNYFSKIPNYIINLLKGIGDIITNEDICFYLLKSVNNIINNLDCIEIKNNEIFNYIDIIIVKFINNNSSFYYNCIYWNLICNLILKTNPLINENSRNIYVKIYCGLINHMLNSNKEVLSIDNLYFGYEEKNLENELYKNVIQKINNFMKSQMNFENINVKNNFLQDNNLEEYPIEMNNIIYYSLCPPNILDDYINNNISKIFSVYMNYNARKEILININCIQELSLIFNNYTNVNYELYNDIYLNLKILLKSSGSFQINDFELYEKLLYNYIWIFKKSFPDYLINEIELINIPQQSKFNLYFVKMYLFNLLVSIHNQVFKKKEFEHNKNVMSNIKNIYNYLNENYKSLIDINQIIFLKSLIIIMLIMNYLEIQYTFNIDIEIIFNYFEVLKGENIFYLIKYFQIFFQKNFSDTYIDTFQKFINKSLNILNENNKNFDYINVLTFLLAFLDKNKLSNENYSKIIKDSLKNNIISNVNKNWLLIKLSSEILIQNIKEDYNLISIYDEILIEYAKINEFVGKASYILQTSPLYIKSPFNLKVKSILNLKEEFKFGFYIRMGILKFYEDIINKIDLNNHNLINLILITINKVIEEIDFLSDFKPELEFGDNHRKKIRLCQLLLTLGSIFDKQNIDLSKEMYKETKNSISNFLISIIQKINIFSVDFYIYLFSIIFLQYSYNFRIFLLNSLIIPETKSYIITSCLIISGISLIERKNINEDEINQFINAITIQCTSNICNIRGYAQYFISKMENLFSAISNNYLSNSFIEYLKDNPNIQKFFQKFDTKYNLYIFLLKNLSVENILERSYDEIYNEENIKEKNISYKILSDENPIIFDNQKYLKISSNWKKILEPENISKNMFNKTLNRRFDIIILGSLLEKTPNLGGLVRTCEIFNIGALTIPSEDILKDKIFLESSSSCEKLVPLLSIPKVTIKEFIIAYRKLGYSIVGLEQTQNSIDIKKFKFKEKMVLVLGNEKEGIPQDIIDLIDNCVIINQFGEVRSLNVHASAAIMIWECIKCLTNEKK